MDRFERRLSLFAKSWALATLFHQARSVSWITGAPETALTFASFLLICVRITPFRVGLYLILQGFTIYIRLPWEVTNHWIFSFFVGSSGVTALLLAMRRDGSWTPTARTWLEEFIPPARILFLLLYVFVTLHKLNSGFLDTDYSCATVHYLELRRLIPMMPDAEWARLGAIYATLGVEAGIPLLLYFGRTRFIGVCLVLGFHTLVGLNNFFDFSTMLFAMMVVFIPDESVPAVRLEMRPLVALVMAAGLTLLVGQLSQESYELGIIPGFIYGGGFLCFLLVAGARPQGVSSLDPYPFAFNSYLRMCPILLLILNGLCPYLGLKTESSFSMFSNLRTEGGMSNHLFIPSRQVFGFQEELVQILESNNPLLSRRTGRWIPYQAVPLLLEDDVRIRVTPSVRFRTSDGTIRSLDNTGDSPVFSGGTAYVLRKLLAFRDFETVDDMSCRH